MAFKTSNGSLGATSHLSSQPGFRQGPVAHYCAGRNAEYFGGLFNRQTSKKPQFKYLAFSLIEAGQTLQGIIQSDNLSTPPVGDNRLVERYLTRAAPSFRGPSVARVVDQDTPHHLSGDGEKVCTAFPMDVLLIDQPHEGLVY